MIALIAVVSHTSVSLGRDEVGTPLAVLALAAGIRTVAFPIIEKDYVRAFTVRALDII